MAVGGGHLVQTQPWGCVQASPLRDQSRVPPVELLGTADTHDLWGGSFTPLSLSLLLQRHRPAVQAAGG